MPLDFTLTNHRCRYCGAAMLVAAIASDPPAWRKTAPVLVCRTCDFGPAATSPEMHRTLKAPARKGLLGPMHRFDDDDDDPLGLVY